MKSSALLLVLASFLLAIVASAPAETLGASSGSVTLDPATGSLILGTFSEGKTTCGSLGCFTTPGQDALASAAVTTVAAQQTFEWAIDTTLLTPTVPCPYPTPCAAPSLSQPTFSSSGVINMNGATASIDISAGSSCPSFPCGEFGSASIVWVDWATASNGDTLIYGTVSAINPTAYYMNNFPAVTSYFSNLTAGGFITLDVSCPGVNCVTGTADPIGTVVGVDIAPGTPPVPQNTPEPSTIVTMFIGLSACVLYSGRRALRESGKLKCILG